MGIFSFWNRANDFDLTAEDLATCEGYVSATAFRKLEAAKASARSEAGGSLYSLARLVATRIVAGVATDRAPASGGTAAAATAQGAAPVADSVPAASSTAQPAPLPTSADHHIDKAA